MEKLNKKLKERIENDYFTTKLSDRFQLMVTDKARVSFALMRLSEYNILPQAKCAQKSEEESRKLRFEGNEIFIRNKSSQYFVEACKIYTQSIAFAPNNSVELALAFANRSAVLFKLGLYDKCTEDIERALALNYPEHLKIKLLLRKTECLTILERSGLEETYEEIQKLMERMSLDIAKKEEVKKKFDEAVEGSRKYKGKTKSQEKPYWFDQMLQDFENSPKNSEVPCCSDALRVEYNDTFGRHVVATRDIHASELIAIEKPYAMFLLSDNVYTHCAECLAISWASIPCNHCVHAMYCSRQCLESAWKRYHDVECPVMGHLISMQMHHFELFSVRLAILAVREAGSIEKLFCNIQEVDKCNDPRKRGFSEGGTFLSNTYKSTYSLTTNTEKRSLADLFDRAVSVACIIYYLATTSTFFGKKLSGNMEQLAFNNIVTMIGGLILRHQQMLPSNAHSYEEERNFKPVDIGAAVLPFFSFLNHSCDPNVSRFSSEGREILYAMQPIKRGAQIFDNYGVHYALMSKLPRQDILKNQFYFICKCRACVEDWPLYNYIPSYQETVLSQALKHKLKNAMSKYAEYVEDATNGNIKDKPEIIKDLFKMMDILVKHVTRPCVELNMIEETLKRVFALLGNRFEVPEIVD